jgi:hypothetical protein
MVRRLLGVGIVALVGSLVGCQGESMNSGGAGGEGGSGGDGGAGGNPWFVNPCSDGTLEEGDVCGGSAGDPIHGECEGGSCWWIDRTCLRNPEGTPCQGGTCAHNATGPVCCERCVRPDGTCDQDAPLNSAGAPCP